MNPIALFQEIEQSYREYLETTFHFRDSQLQQSFSAALSAQYLSNGPFIEAIPNFLAGQTPDKFFPELLHTNLEEAFLSALNGSRNLYDHQEMAIRKIFANRNVMVATGTGSGKTEAFLYPILLHLYREYLQGTLKHPGVRALILYPLNALSFDQRERLGVICESLTKNHCDFHFTFGQYIGETPENENDGSRNGREKMNQRFPGELIFRDEMRENPPHILLTNYSMLEYLLIRPKDSELFDNGRANFWQFLVLDEAHQYRGAKGMEMAMLIRRLKQRLREGGRQSDFRCIATSATITNKEDDLDKVATFVSTLFDEKFYPEDIVWGRTVPMKPPIAQIQINPDDYGILLNEIKGNQNPVKLSEYLIKLKLVFDTQKNLKQNLGILLGLERRVYKLHQFISETPEHFDKLAELLELNRTELSNLMELISLSAGNDSAVHHPALSFKYHYFLRSLEGAFLHYLPEPEIVLSRKSQNGSVSFEVALCRNCGQHYFVGIRKDGKLTEPIRDPGDPDFGVRFYLPLDAASDTLDAFQEDSGQLFNLCVECGAINRGELNCGHRQSIKVIEEDASEDEYRADQLKKCRVCEYTAAGRDPVREIVHGSDGPQAVIATRLYQKLPAGRKKILAFADSRQEAAFFAWYLEDSFTDILNRNLIFQAIQQLSQGADEGISIKEIAYQLENLYKQNYILPETTGRLELNREIWSVLYREFLTDEHRISLEGIGLIQWYMKFPAKYDPPSALCQAPWKLSKEQAFALIQVLLDLVRKERAVELTPGPQISINWNDLNLGVTQMSVRIGEPRKQRNMKSWDGKMTRRVQYLARLLARINPGLGENRRFEAAIEMLRIIWDSFQEYDFTARPGEKILVTVNDAKRLNPDWWRLLCINQSTQINQCKLCGQFQLENIHGVCTRHRCTGDVLAINVQNFKNNHYRNLYQSQFPGKMRVEEHTAQLTTSKAQEYQRAFQKGDIHLLSSSTTFELGVDLGDLDIVFLRNIPPETFNYAQRVGRAGRRRGFPGMSITYCHRRPHDLYHFDSPQRIIKGEIRPPILKIENQKIIQRHIMAAVLSKYFKINQTSFYSRVEGLLENFEQETFISKFRQFMLNNQDELCKILKKIVPESMFKQLGLDDGSWITSISDNSSTLVLAIETTREDVEKVRQFEISSKKAGNYKDAEWAKYRVKTIYQEDVLSFLSRKAVIPKYGFPVDVVELETNRYYSNKETTAIALQRDLILAISEFAPTSVVIANKFEWKSYGLKKIPAREWPMKVYLKCEKHNIFKSGMIGNSETLAKCCSSAVQKKFIIPQFGFETGLDKPKRPSGKNERFFSSRPYFVNFKDGNPDEHDFELVKITKSSPGIMVVICEGRRGKGFWICTQCGAGFEKPLTAHRNAFGKDCNGKLERVSLAHEILTDIVQIHFTEQPKSDTDTAIDLAYSLAYSILEGAAFVLDVPVNDLNTTVSSSQGFGKIPPIILYDNVPGGAGLVAELEKRELLYQSLMEAQERVSGKCGCDSSCYGCLRNYRNQFIHHKLNREAAKNFLDNLLTRWK